MDPGHDVDSEPVYHLSPETQGAVVNHFLCSARTPVLEHTARPCSDKRRISTSAQGTVSAFPFLPAVHYSLDSALWSQTLGKWRRNVWGAIRGTDVLTAEARRGVLCRLKIFVARDVRQTVVARLYLRVTVFDIDSNTNYARWKWRRVLTSTPLRRHISWGRKVHSWNVVFERKKCILIWAATVGMIDDRCITILVSISTDFIYSGRC